MSFKIIQGENPRITGGFNMIIIDYNKKMIGGVCKVKDFRKEFDDFIKSIKE